MRPLFYDSPELKPFDWTGPSVVRRKPLTRRELIGIWQWNAWRWGFCPSLEFCGRLRDLKLSRYKLGRDS